MKVFIFLLSFTCSFLSAFAQRTYSNFDTLTTMHWNTYNYNGTSGVNNPDRNLHIRRVLQYMKPDIFTVNEQQNSNGPSTLLSQCLNVFGETRYQSAAWMTEGGGDSYSHIFYNRNKFALLSQRGIASTPRGIAVYRMLYLPSVEQGSTDSVILLYYSLHPKASNTASDQSQRNTTANTLMADVRGQAPTDQNMLIQADLNIYTPTEASYLAYTNATSFRGFRDPLNRTPATPATADFRTAIILTQSPRTTQFDGGVNGGLDSRFDFIFVQPHMMRDTARVRLVPNSYRAIGNDGRANGGNIVMSGNTAYPDSVATGVYYGSDHLPVASKLAIARTVTITATADKASEEPFLRMNTLNPSSINILPQGCHCKGLVEIMNTAGQTVSQIIVAPGESEVTIPTLPIGVYFIRATEGDKQVNQRFLVTQ